MLKGVNMQVSDRYLCTREMVRCAETPVVLLIIRRLQGRASSWTTIFQPSTAQVHGFTRVSNFTRLTGGASRRPPVVREESTSNPREVRKTIDGATSRP